MNYKCNTHGFIGKQTLNIHVPAAGENPEVDVDYCLYCLLNQLSSVLDIPTEVKVDECQSSQTH